MAESMRDKACKSPGVSQLTLASSAGASDAEAALVDFSLSWPVSALALCGIGKRSIRLPRGPPTCSGMTPLPWSVLAPSASVRICCRLSVLRAAISHSTRNKHISARQKSAKATFHAPPCSSCLCLPPPRLTMVCSCALLSCGFSTATSAARGFLRLAVAAFEVVDPAFQLGEARLDVQGDEAAARVDRQQRRLAGHVGHQHDFHAFLVRRFLVDQLLHHVADRVDDAVAKENTDEGTNDGGADVCGDLARGRALADGVHGDGDAQHGGQDAEARHRLGDLAERLGRLFQFLVDGGQLLLQHAFQFVGVDLAHGHQTEVVDDEGQQLRLLQHARVALEQRAVLGRLDVGVERLQAAGGQLQQLVHQQQQLALEFRIVFLAEHDFLDLREQFLEHVGGIAQHQRADAGAGDDDQLDRLPDLRKRAAFEREAAEDTAQDNEDADDLLHDDTPFVFTSYVLRRRSRALQHGLHFAQGSLVELADPGVGQVQHGGDLLVAEFEFIIHLHDALLALVESAQRLFQAAPHHQLVFRAGRAVVADGVLQRLVEAGDQLGVLVHLVSLVGFRRQLQAFDDVLLARLAAQPPRQRAHGVAQLVALLAHGARAPVLAAKLVEDGAAHAQAGVAAEGGVGLAVAAQGLEQAHQADLFHVVAVDRAGDLRVELAHDALDQRRIRQQVLLLVDDAMPVPQDYSLSAYSMMSLPIMTSENGFSRFSAA